MSSGFKKGRSGNPSGRPPGLVDRRMQFRDALEQHAPEVMETVVRLAKAGDPTAMRIFAERVLPMAKPGYPVDLGRSLAGTVTEKMTAVFAAVTEQRVTPDEAQQLVAAIATEARVLELVEFEQRLRDVEEAVHAKRSAALIATPQSGGEVEPSPQNNQRRGV